MRSGLELDRTARFGLIDEWQSWQHDYIPSGGIVGKVYLDVGACCGESAHLAYRNGAASVTSIEMDPRRCAIIRRNAKRFGWPDFTLIERPFRIEDLDIPHQFAKLDIEGWEALLLERDLLGPMSLEVHNWYLVHRFKERGFRLLTQPDPMLGKCIMANWT